MTRRESKTFDLRVALAVGAAVFCCGLLAGVKPVQAAGASLKMSPSSGSFEVGSQFEVSLILDTGGEAVNAIGVDVEFPAEKLQVINPAASTSFITVWASPPTYSNTDGTLSLQGGLPNPGIKTSAGVISAVTFRVKSAGRAILKYKPTSTVLRNDGQGTKILTSTSGAEFNFTIPPPAGPAVSSPTHGDFNEWYNNPRVQLAWDPVAEATGYSYSFDQNAKQIPDDTIDTVNTRAEVEANSDGIWYFHIKAKGETWGGVTHVPIKIDITPPAAFTIQASKKLLTTEETGSLTFLTTDGASGIDRYEIKRLAKSNQQAGSNTLFVETTSPYVLGKQLAGDYEYVVRAIDRAGNTTTATTTISVVAGGLSFWARTPLLRNAAVANTALIALMALVILTVGILVLRRLRIRSTFRHDLAALEHDARKKMQVLQEELQELQSAKSQVDRDLGIKADQPPTPPPRP